MRESTVVCSGASKACLVVRGVCWDVPKANLVARGVCWAWTIHPSMDGWKVGSSRVYCWKAWNRWKMTVANSVAIHWDVTYWGVTVSSVKDSVLSRLSVPSMGANHQRGVTSWHRPPLLDLHVLAVRRTYQGRGGKQRLPMRKD